MKLIGTLIAKCYPNETEPVFLVSTYDVSSISYAYRRALKEISKFLTRTIIPKLKIGTRDVITHEGSNFCVIRWSDGLVTAILTDTDYPPRVAFNCCSEIHEDFRSKVPESVYKNITKDNCVNDYKETLREFAKKYKNPQDFDAVTINNLKIDRNKKIVQLQLEELIGNINQLDELVDQSRDLSVSSQQLFKTARKMKKSCCNIT